MRSELRVVTNSAQSFSQGISFVVTERVSERIFPPPIEGSAWKLKYKENRRYIVSYNGAVIEKNTITHLPREAPMSSLPLLISDNILGNYLCIAENHQYFTDKDTILKEAKEGAQTIALIANPPSLRQNDDRCISLEDVKDSLLRRALTTEGQEAGSYVSVDDVLAVDGRLLVLATSRFHPESLDIGGAAITNGREIVHAGSSLIGFINSQNSPAGRQPFFAGRNGDKVGFLSSEELSNSILRLNVLSLPTNSKDVYRIDLNSGA